MLLLSLEPTVAAGAELDEQVLPLAQAPVLELAPQAELELERAPQAEPRQERASQAEPRQERASQAEPRLERAG